MRHKKSVVLRKTGSLCVVSLTSAFTLNVCDLLYVFKSEAVVQCTHIVKCTVFTPRHQTVLILATTTRDLIHFFFLSVHTVRGDEWKSRLYLSETFL